MKRFPIFFVTAALAAFACTKAEPVTEQPAEEPDTYEATITFVRGEYTATLKFNITITE